MNANEILETIERIKHYLWHGNVVQALQHIEFHRRSLTVKTFQKEVMPNLLDEARCIKNEGFGTQC